MDTSGAATWHYTKARQSMRLTAFEVTQGYELVIEQAGYRERRTFQTVDAVLAAQLACERNLFEQGFLLVQLTVERRKSAQSDHSLEEMRRVG